MSDTVTAAGQAQPGVRCHRPPSAPDRRALPSSGPAPSVGLGLLEVVLALLFHPLAGPGRGCGGGRRSEGFPNFPSSPMTESQRRCGWRRAERASRAWGSGKHPVSLEPSRPVRLPHVRRGVVWMCQGPQAPQRDTWEHLLKDGVRKGGQGQGYSGPIMGEGRRDGGLKPQPS